MPLRCLTCGRPFEDVAAYKRHEWRAHGGDLDQGETSPGRRRLESLVENPPEPPTLEP